MQTVIRGGIFTIALAVAIVLCVPVLAVHLYRVLAQNIADAHIKQNFNMPYGMNPLLLNAEYDYANLRRRSVVRYQDLHDVPMLGSV